MIIITLTVKRNVNKGNPPICSLVMGTMSKKFGSQSSELYSLNVWYSFKGIEKKIAHEKFETI